MAVSPAPKIHVCCRYAKLVDFLHHTFTQVVTATRVASGMYPSESAILFPVIRQGASSREQMMMRKQSISSKSAED